MSKPQLSEQIATKVIESGLTGPIIWLLGAHKPFAFLGSQLLLIAQPTLNVFISPTLTQNLTQLLAHEEQFEALINKIEAKATAQHHTKGKTV